MARLRASWRTSLPVVQQPRNLNPSPSPGARISLRLRRWARDPRVEITLSLMTPYVTFWVPEHLGGSGVLATVAAGLFVSWNGPLLIPAATRLQGIFFWDLVVYLLEGFVFLVTGLQARALLERMGTLLLRDLVLAVLLT